MSVTTDTYLSYSAKGIREDLSNEITTISPVDTHFYSKIAEVGASQQKHEWQTDALAAAATNANLEGDVTAYTAATATTRLYNNCQIQKKVFSVSGSLDKAKKAGRVSEVDYQKAKFMKELAKDIEYAFLREVRVDGAAATAPKMRGALNWTTTCLSKDSGATLNADGSVTGGTSRSLTETIFKTVLASAFTAGGNPDTVYVDATQKQNISGFSMATSNYRTAVENSKLNAAVDVYMSDFGALTITPHRGMPSGVVFICDHATWKKATFRPTFSEPLAKTGDATPFHIIVEHTLEARAENGNGRIVNLS